VNTARALYSRKTFYLQPVEFRIGAIVSDGMWYSLPKWRKLAKCSEEEINSWIERNLKSGVLEQASTGAKSFRFSLPSIRNWYTENEIAFGEQIIDFLFPPRIWDDHTEVEGFLEAPLRIISIVSFSITDRVVAAEIVEGLRGIAKVREVDPDQYKAYGLDAAVIKAKIEELSKGKVLKTYARSEAKRRELIDFTPKFANGLMQFYSQFGKALVKPIMNTIKIFLPDPEDQNSQITLWVIAAIEKFDETSAVPFSGYLNSVLHRWPYDLPADHLGKDLSNFQRERSKAIKKLDISTNNGDLENKKTHNHEAIAKEMGLSINTFLESEEKHQIWIKTQTASTLTWDASSEEKQVESNLSGNFTNAGVDTDVILANKISIATIEAAIESQSFAEAFFVISQVDTPELDLSQLRSLSEPFVKALTNHL